MNQRSSKFKYLICSYDYIWMFKLISPNQLINIFKITRYGFDLDVSFIGQTIALQVGSSAVTLHVTHHPIAKRTRGVSMSIKLNFSSMDKIIIVYDY